MDDDLGDIGGMHPSQHFGQIRDRATAQQPLDGQEDDVGLGLSTLALISQGIAQYLFIRRSGFRLEGADFLMFFSRLHDCLVP